MQAVFYGVGAAVIGIIAMSARKLTLKSVGKDKLLWAIYLLLAAVTVITESEIAWLFLAAGILVWLLRAPPKWMSSGRLHSVDILQMPAISGLITTTEGSQLLQIAIFFPKAGDVHSLLPVYGYPRAVFQEIRQAAGRARFR
jgi:chromate transporter